jgi:hypothetical protein
MNKFVKILLGIVGVIVIAISAVFFFTADMVGAADEFFMAIKNKDMDKAYSYLSEDFKSGTPKDALQRYLEKNSINSFKEASWESRSINGGRGNLVGSITTESGGVVPISLSFVKGDKGWKIYSIQKPSSGIQEESTPVQMPSEQEMVKLVSDSMKLFAESVNEKSMVKFHSHVSNLWQQQFTPEKFDEAFGAFYDLGADLTVLEKYSPQFSTKPNINEDGVLVIAGQYPTEPSKVHFEQKYIYEGLGWKLIGFSTNIK